MTIEVDIKSSNLPAFVELFKIDPTILSLDVIYLTPNPIALNFGNNEYLPFPIKISGVALSNDEGGVSRPTLEVSNIRSPSNVISKYFGSLAFLYQDFVGVSVTYIRTFETYLDTAYEISAPPLKWTISKKLAHNKAFLQFELRNPLDSENGILPARVALRKDFPGLNINRV